ncbi:30S ribosomal protein S8e [Candidatus Woesearchaeota archaeon]|nr:30S ribosomal protein S8e [Candidatus Woesearchaeota archaeon]
MVFTQTRSKRKATGGRYIASRKKKLYESGKSPTLTKLGKTKNKKEKTKGGNTKTRLLDSDMANVVDPKTKKASKAKIETVLESPANRHFVRRNIIVKGTIIQTDKGKAKVTSRPGQDGIINAVLVTEK